MIYYRMTDREFTVGAIHKVGAMQLEIVSCYWSELSDCFHLYFRIREGLSC